MIHRKRIPKPRASTLALGKICGCGKCRYCSVLATELTLQAMVEEVRQGKEIAERSREDKLKEWRK